MSRNLTCVIILLGSVLLASQVSAQDKRDSVYTPAERNAMKTYDKTMGDRLGIFRGPAVVPYALRSTGTPNFRDTTDYYEDGTVNYDFRVYHHVPLIYNTERDMLESKMNSATPFTLLSDRVIDFDLLGRHFINFELTADNKIMSPGFYEQIYNGKVQVLARHTKTLVVQTSDRVAMNVFNPQTSYYIKKGNKYYNADSQGKFLNALSDKKKELQQYIKTNRMEFGDNPAKTMYVLAAYYDRLTN